MALQITRISPHGFVAQDAYCRVELVSIVGKTQIGFAVRSYKSQDETVPFSEDGYSAPYDMDGENPLCQAYNHLKSLPEFSGAMDC